MSKVVMSKYMKDQATDYADNEASIKGFQVGGPRWKKAFALYITEAYSTMSVGRSNPYRMPTLKKSRTKR